MQLNRNKVAQLMVTFDILGIHESYYLTLSAGYSPFKWQGLCQTYNIGVFQIYHVILLLNNGTWKKGVITW